jgi:hypothetical protein
MYINIIYVFFKLFDRHPGGLPQRFADRDGGGNRDIERAHAFADRDFQPRVGGLMHLGRDARRLAAEQQNVIRLKAMVQIGVRGGGREHDEGGIRAGCASPRTRARMDGGRS